MLSRADIDGWPPEANRTAADISGTHLQLDNKRHQRPH